MPKLQEHFSALCCWFFYRVRAKKKESAALLFVFGLGLNADALEYTVIPAKAGIFLELLLFWRFPLSRE